jgi:hypothetical protein
MYFLYELIYLNNFTKTYYPVISIEPSPSSDDILSTIVRHEKLAKLSSFKNLAPHEHYNPCATIVKSFKYENEAMQVNELPDLIQFLYINNKKIDKNITKVMGNVALGEGKRLIAAIVD